MLSPAEDLDSDADARNFTQDSLSRNWAVAGDMIPCMHWWQIPLFIAVAAWALYLYSTPSARVFEHLSKIRQWLRSRRM
jgi:hypothetical protein